MGTRHWTVGTIVVIVVARFPQPRPSIARSVLHPFSPRSLEVMASFGFDDANTAFGAALAEAVQESGVARLLPPEALTLLGQALVQRVTFAAPCALTPCRRVCPRCHGDLTLSSPDETRDAHATCWIYAEPEARQVTHRPGWCARCFDVATVQTGIGQTKEVRRRTRFWCGFMEEPVPGNARAYKKRLDHEFPHRDFWMLSKSLGVSLLWLRKWRYRLLVHRSSFMEEATIFRMLHGPGVLERARMNLSSTWVRHLLWKRFQEGGPENLDDLAKDLLCLSNEALVQKCWHWYGPLMSRRRLEQVRLSRDRTDILAIDGNVKLYRQTCGMPFSDVVHCAELDQYLLRGCPHRPQEKGTMCCRHARVPPHETVCKHRLRRALHRPEDSWCSLEVQLAGCAPRFGFVFWRPG